MADSNTGKIGTELVFEDAHCRVWLLSLRPGENSDWHLHELDYVYVVTKAAPARTEYADGAIEEQNDSVGATSLRSAGGPPHRLVNRGRTTYANIVVELKEGVE